LQLGSFPTTARHLDSECDKDAYIYTDQAEARVGDIDAEA